MLQTQDSNLDRPTPPTGKAGELEAKIENGEHFVRLTGMTEWHSVHSDEALAMITMGFER